MSDEEIVTDCRGIGSLVSFAGGLAAAWMAPYRPMRSLRHGALGP